MAGISPTMRTLKLIRDQGGICDIVERFNPHVGPYGIRQDCFGFIDILCIMPGEGIVAIQSCGQDVSGHVKKILEDRNEITYEWLKYANFYIYGWRKVKLKRGGKAIRWRPRIIKWSLSENGDLQYREL